MAKGIEDTAFYRYARLTGLNEVGGDPGHVGLAPDELHTFAARQLATWPTTMTTLSTHDTKRSEDVRARLSVISELPAEWAQLGRDGARRWPRPTAVRGSTRATEYLLWQTAVGAWPISDRPAAGLRHQGDPRGEGAHDLDRARTPATRPTWPRSSTALTTEPALGDHVRALGRAGRAGRPRRHARAEAAPARPARRPRRLPGHRARRPVARRPRQPPPRRLRAAPRPAGPARRGRGARGPGRREAARHLACAAAAPRPPRVVHRRAGHVCRRAHLERARRGRRSWRRRRGRRWSRSSTRLSERLRSSGGWGAASVALPEGDWRRPAQRRGRRPSSGRPGRARRTAARPSGCPARAT